MILWNEDVSNDQPDANEDINLNRLIGRSEEYGKEKLLSYKYCVVSCFDKTVVMIDMLKCE